jgi:hypothetical protein
MFYLDNAPCHLHAKHNNSIHELGYICTICILIVKVGCTVFIHDILCFTVTGHPAHIKLAVEMIFRPEYSVINSKEPVCCLGKERAALVKNFRTSDTIPATQSIDHLQRLPSVLSKAIRRLGLHLRLLESTGVK